MRVIATVSLPIETWTEIEKAAKDSGFKSKSAFINQIFKSYLKRTKEKVDKNEE